MREGDSGVDAKQFDRRMREVGRLVEANSSEAVRKAAIAVDQGVVLATPVDTGRARSNWIVSTGAPSTETREAYAPGSGLGHGETANAQAALAQGLDAVAQHSAGQAIYVSNNLPYIGELEDGSSQQAPAGMIGAGLQAGRAVLRRAKLLEKGGGK